MLGFVINVQHTAKLLNKRISEVNKEIVQGLIKKGFHCDTKIVVDPSQLHAIYGNYETKEIWAGSYGWYHYGAEVRECYEEILPLEYKLTFKKIKET